MSKQSLCCSSAAFRPSTNVYDIRRELFGKKQVKDIDSTMDFNLRHENWVCPDGWEQKGNRCVFQDIPYPTWYAWNEPFKARVLRELKKDQNKK